MSGLDRLSGRGTQTQILTLIADSRVGSQAQGPRGRRVWVAPIPSQPCPVACRAQNTRTPIIGRQDLLPDAPRSCRPLTPIRRHQEAPIYIDGGLLQSPAAMLPCQGGRSGSREADVESNERPCATNAASARFCNSGVFAEGLICVSVLVHLRWTLETQRFVPIFSAIPLAQAADPHSMCRPALVESDSSRKAKLELVRECWNAELCPRTTMTEALRCIQSFACNNACIDGGRYRYSYTCGTEDTASNGQPSYFISWMYTSPCCCVASTRREGSRRQMTDLTRQLAAASAEPGANNTNA